MGRLLAGLTSDHFGAFNTMTIVIAFTTICIFVLWVPFGRYIGVLYPFSFILGLGTGSFLSITPVCVGRVCKVEEYGQWLGTCYFVSSFG